jgi:hypothetical protein
MKQYYINNLSQFLPPKTFGLLSKASFIYLLFYCSFCFSQSKYEKEERIDVSEFPKVAQNYFNTISDQVNYLKYYKEIDGDKQSFEVKFKLKKQYYSVEFDTLGIIEDIEIVIKKKHIPQAVLNNISSYFNESFKKHRLIKIQKQYIKTSNKTDLQFLQQILTNINEKNTNYEIISEVKTNEGRTLKEFIFNSNGTFEKSRTVTSSSYEHALY